MRDKLKEHLCQIMHSDERIVIVLADSGDVELGLVREHFSDRIVECGIAEANAVGVAAGMSSCGYIPIIYGMGAFLAYRAFEFIRDDVCLQNRNVKIIGSGGGLGYNNLGPTHHSTEDIAVMTALPKMTVLAPSTPLEVGSVLRAAVAYNGPVYVRFGKAFEEEIFDSEPAFEIGKSHKIIEGMDAAIFVTGSMLPDVIKAVDFLKKDGICPCVINISSLKPLDENLVLEVCDRCENIVTVEEHNIIGGLGAIIASTCAKNGKNVHVKMLGLQDEFCFDYGWRQVIRKQYGLSKEGIAEAVREAVKR